MIVFDRFMLAASVSDLDEELRARELADVLEFRMDLAADPLGQLRDYDGELPIIATNRAAWEGGEATDEGRLADLRTAAEHPRVGAIDLELASLRRSAGRETAAHARDHDAAVIASSHSFEEPPTLEQMAELLREGTRRGDIAKLAVEAEDRRTVLDLLAATDRASRAGDAVATMAMGRAGRHSRVVAPIYGSRLGYAPIEPEAATAPGQYDLATLARLVEELS